LPSPSNPSLSDWPHPQTENDDDDDDEDDWNLGVTGPQLLVATMSCNRDKVERLNPDLPPLQREKLR
jgi:hypothetical protein